MELLFFLGGVLLGSLISSMIHLSKTIYGTITVDKEKELCSIAMNSKELENVKTTRVTLQVVHKNSQE